MKVEAPRSGSEYENHSVVSDSLQPHGLSQEFSRQGYWRGLPFPSPGDLPDPGILYCRWILYHLNPRTRDTELEREAKPADTSQPCQGPCDNSKARLFLPFILWLFLPQHQELIMLCVPVLCDDSPVSLFIIFHISCHLPVTVPQRVKHI